MLGLVLPTISSFLTQGGLTNQVNGTSPSNLTGTNATQSSTGSMTAAQLAAAFQNLISQIGAAHQAGAANPASATAASASTRTQDSNLEATLNQLLQTLKLSSSSTNAAGLNAATSAHSALSLAQRLAQQRVPANSISSLSAVA